MVMVTFCTTIRFWLFPLFWLLTSYLHYLQCFVIFVVFNNFSSNIFQIFQSVLCKVVIQYVIYGACPDGCVV